MRRAFRWWCGEWRFWWQVVKRAAKGQPTTWREDLRYHRIVFITYAAFAAAYVGFVWLVHMLAHRGA